jgi:hypothetical protein
MCPASDPHVFIGSHTRMCTPPRVLSLTGCYILVRMGEIENQENNHHFPFLSFTNNTQYTDVIHKYKDKLYSK